MDILFIVHYVTSFRLANGKRIHRYAKTRKEAKENLKQLIREKEQGSLVTERNQKLGDYLDYWLKMRRNSLAIKTTTYVSYSSYMHRNVIPVLGNITLQQLTGTQIQSLYTLLRNQGIGPNTVHLIHTILSAALNDAVKWHRILFNPCKHLTAPRAQRTEMKYISNRSEGPVPARTAWEAISEDSLKSAKYHLTANLTANFQNTVLASL